MIQASELLLDLWSQIPKSQLWSSNNYSNVGTHHPPRQKVHPYGLGDTCCRHCYRELYIVTAFILLHGIQTMLLLLVRALACERLVLEICILRHMLHQPGTNEHEAISQVQEVVRRPIERGSSDVDWRLVQTRERPDAIFHLFLPTKSNSHVL